MSQIIIPVAGGGGGGGAILTLTGNSGGPQSPVGNNFNILTQNATPQFVTSTGNAIINFGLTNLVLGSSLPVIAGGVENVGMGLNVLNSVTVGSRNTGIGYYSLQTGTN